MKIISWNVQGAKKAKVHEEVKFLQRSHKPDILFLIETMTNDRNTAQILPKMGFDNYDFISPINHSGVIWVLWNNNRIHASILRKDSRAIHMLVHDPSNLNNLVISGVYGPAQCGEKEHFWANLEQLNNVIDLPWCIVGDLNELEKQAEKKGDSRSLFGERSSFLILSRLFKVNQLSLNAIPLHRKDGFMHHGFMNGWIEVSHVLILQDSIPTFLQAMGRLLFLIIVSLLSIPIWSANSKNLLRFVFKVFGLIIEKWNPWLGSAGNLTLKDP